MADFSNSEHRAGFLNAWSHGFVEQGDSKPFIRRREIALTPVPSSLYHYTTIDGFQGIVKEDGIWATNIAFLNDPEEYKFGADVALGMVDCLLSKPQRYHRGEQFIDVLRLCRERLFKEAVTEYYVASLSAAGDDLDQWRAYCPNGGVAIEFDVSVRNPFSAPPIYMLWPVSYGRKELEWLTLLYARRYFKEMLLDIAFYKGKISEDHVSEYARFLSESISSRFLDHKHPAYANEREVRVIIGPNGKDRFAAKRFRSRNNTIIPYYSTADILVKRSAADEPSDLTRLPIKSVTVSPLENQQTVATGLRHFLDYFGHAHAEIHCSRIPYRTP